MMRPRLKLLEKERKNEKDNNFNPSIGIYIYICTGLEGNSRQDFFLRLARTPRSAFRFLPTAYCLLSKWYSPLSHKM